MDVDSMRVLQTIIIIVTIAGEITDQSRQDRDYHHQEGGPRDDDHHRHHHDHRRRGDENRPPR
jgi:hypothetical protein